MYALQRLINPQRYGRRSSLTRASLLPFHYRAV